MASTKRHVKMGTLVALNEYVQEVQRRGLTQDPIRDYVAVQAAKWIGRNVATLPDRLEPALSPSHRGMFHSKNAHRLLETAKDDIRNNPQGDVVTQTFLLMAMSAYQSHIEMDAKTPMSVPDYQPVQYLLDRYFS